MAVPVIMPRQGQTVESCIIEKWHKKKGDRVEEGDILFTYETDKATFDEEAKESGVLLDIFFKEGDDVPVLTNVCVIGKEGEDASIYDPRTQKSAASDSEAMRENKESLREEDKDRLPDEKTRSSLNIIEEGRIKISPRAKNLAQKAGIDYRYATPSGPDNRIVEEDIISLIEKGTLFTAAAKEESTKIGATSIGIGAAEGTGLGGRITIEDIAKGKEEHKITVEQGPIASAEIHKEQVFEASMHADEFTEVKLTNIRKAIASAMHNSLSETAQLTLNASFDATEILAFRKKIKENKDKFGLQNITINDILLFAVSRMLPKHKYLNAHFLDDKILLFNSVHLGVAIDTERGLMVPTIFNADKKSLSEISKEAKKLTEECQKGSINPDLLKGGTFTVTNLGMLDIESFTPVLNPPQTGILGVNNVVIRVKEVDGKYVNYPAMGLSLTFDHRAIDGAPAARFLADLKINLENFYVLLAQ